VSRKRKKQTENHHNHGSISLNEKKSSQSARTLKNAEKKI